MTVTEIAIKSHFCLKKQNKKERLPLQKRQRQKMAYMCTVVHTRRCSRPALLCAQCAIYCTQWEGLSYYIKVCVCDLFGTLSHQSFKLSFSQKRHQSHICFMLSRRFTDSKHCNQMFVMNIQCCRGHNIRHTDLVNASKSVF